jgi:hypothetical protein
MVTNGFARRGTRLVKRPRGELLPRPRFAADEHDPCVRREPPNQAEDLLHRRTATRHAAVLRLEKYRSADHGFVHAFLRS